MPTRFFQSQFPDGNALGAVASEVSRRNTLKPSAELHSKWAIKSRVKPSGTAQTTNPKTSSAASRYGQDGRPGKQCDRSAAPKPTIPKDNVRNPAPVRT